MNKTLFLDIDGVLHPLGCGQDEMFNKESCEVLREIVSEGGITQVIVSSGWRCNFSLDELRDVFRKHGVFEDENIVIGVTPPKLERWPAIMRTLLSSGIPRIGGFVILDDETPAEWAEPYTVTTDTDTGLKPTHKDLALGVLEKTTEMFAPKATV